MRTIAINAVNSNSGGGKSIRDSYIKLLNEQPLKDRYVLFVAKEASLPPVTNPNIEIMKLPTFYSRAIAVPLVYRYLLGRILDRIGANVVLNVGNLIIRTEAKQIAVFHWPYGVDVHKKVWMGMTPTDWLTRKTKLWFLERYFREADIVVAQTEFIRRRLIEKYELADVRIIGNTVTLTDNADTRADLVLPEGVRLVYPCVYYPHKNLEILLDVGERIKARNLPYRIVTTVNSDGSVAARRFVKNIVERGLGETIVNIGQVQPAHMPGLYHQCDALLMPSLLESFSIVYPEAMHYGLPVFTSDMWFAHSVCGDAAKYFDPFDADDILNSVQEVMSDDASKRTLINAGHRHLSSFPSWPDNFALYQAIIRELLGDPDHGDRYERKHI